ncbi:MAG: hypothetical protein JO108_34270 [Acidobacteriaceae bacterium]|nr:hypothetical protein [Acidobacteriaceae bacterium]
MANRTLPDPCRVGVNGPLSSAPLPAVQTPMDGDFAAENPGPSQARVTITVVMVVW